MDNLGLDRRLQIDRIDNNGNYQPGNIQLVAPSVNMNNQRRSTNTRRMHRFRQIYPLVCYADATIVNLLKQGLSFKQIEERFHKISNKPKGVYGTFSTPDQTIASLAKDS